MSLENTAIREDFKWVTHTVTSFNEKPEKELQLLSFTKLTFFSPFVGCCLHLRRHDIRSSWLRFSYIFFSFQSHCYFYLLFSVHLHL